MPMAILNIGGGLISGIGAKTAGNTQADAATEAGAVSAAAALKSGKIGAKAAKRASKAQIKAAKKAIGTIKDYGTQSIATQEKYYGEATNFLAPYRKVGEGAVYSLADLYGLPTADNPEGGQPLSDESIAAFERSPDYRFALEQGTKAQQAGAAAKGSLLSGGAQKELAEFGSGLASQNFGNYFNRLMELSRLGENAAGSGANTALSTGKGIAGSLETVGSGVASGQAGIGDARATGILGKAAAKQQGILGAASAFANAISGAGEAEAAGTAGMFNNIGSGISSAFGNFNLMNMLKGAGGASSGTSWLTP